MENQFQRVEDEYFRLKGQLSTGRITRAEFESALHDLMFTDEQGRYWMLGTESGNWFVHDGKEWVQANPSAARAPGPPADLPERARAGAPVASPGQPPRPVPQSAVSVTPAPAPQASSGGCGRTLLIGCLVLVVACIVLGGGGYFALQSGALTPAMLMKLAGMGPGTIVVNNFRDEAVEVKLLRVDAAADSSAYQDTRVLEAFDVKNFGVANAGLYRVTFALAGGGDVGTCTLRLRGGEEYQFVTLPDHIVVNRPNSPPVAGRDLVVATSALCRAE